MDQFLITCIMVTDKSPDCILQSVSYFLRQDYPAKELLILTQADQEIGPQLPLDAGVRVAALDRGASNEDRWQFALDICRGRYVAAWDPGDWIGGGRLSIQAKHLAQSGAGGCVAQSVAHYSPVHGRAWQVEAAASSAVWQKTLFWDRTRAKSVCGEIASTAGAKGASRAQAHFAELLAPWYVAIVHAREPHSAAWKGLAVGEVARMLGEDREFYSTLRSSFGNAARRDRAPRLRPAEAPVSPLSRPPALPSATPLVSCLMPTHNRRRFVPQAIRQFLEQDYPERELIVIDDGTDPVEDLVPADPRIQYCRLRTQRSIGTKRNLAAELAKGEVFICWDDDDWYAAHRISQQVTPLLAKQCHATVLNSAYIVDLARRQFLKKDRSRAGRMFNLGANWGTLAWTREWWEKGIRFPDYSLAEDVALKESLVRHGARVTHLPDEELHLYVRHGANTWQFSAEEAFQDGWSAVAPPPFFPAELLPFYGFKQATKPSISQLTSMCH